MSILDPFVPRHGPRPPGSKTCGYSTDGINYCEDEPTWHIAWDPPPDFAVSFTCTTHMDVVQARWMYDDRHQVTADCGKPGAMWSYRDHLCRLPGMPTPLAEERAEPQPATA